MTKASGEALTWHQHGLSSPFAKPATLGGPLCSLECLMQAEFLIICSVRYSAVKFP